MTSNIDTIVGLATLLGSSFGLIMGGILIVGLVLRALDRTRSRLGRDNPATR